LQLCICVLYYCFAEKTHSLWTYLTVNVLILLVHFGTMWAHPPLGTWHIIGINCHKVAHCWKLPPIILQPDEFLCEVGGLWWWWWVTYTEICVVGGISVHNHESSSQHHNLIALPSDQNFIKIWDEYYYFKDCLCILPIAICYVHVDAVLCLVVAHQICVIF
jgi:hypothetical protein